MSIKLIAAVSLNNVIGKDGQIPWHVPQDLAFFKKMTVGHSVVMGRRTYDSIGKPLPERDNWVLTHDDHFKFEGRVAPNINSIVKQYDKTKDLWVIGGAQIYDRFINGGLIEEMYITHMHWVVNGDNMTYFPHIDHYAWNATLYKSIYNDYDEVIGTIVNYKKR